MKTHPKHRILWYSCFCPCLQNCYPWPELHLCSSSFQCPESRLLGWFGSLLSFNLLPNPLLFCLSTPSSLLTHWGQWPSHCCHLCQPCWYAIIHPSSHLPPKVPFCLLGVWTTVVSRHLMLASWWTSSSRSLAGEAVTSLHAILGLARTPGSQACTPHSSDWHTKKQKLCFMKS